MIELCSGVGDHVCADGLISICWNVQCLLLSLLSVCSEWLLMCLQYMAKCHIHIDRGEERGEREREGERGRERERGEREWEG